MSNENPTIRALSPMAQPDGRTEPSAEGFPGNLVRPEEGEGQVAGRSVAAPVPGGAEGPTVAGYPGDHRLPEEPHPQAAMPPGRPKRVREIEVDAATVDAWMKKLGLQLLKEDGWTGNDGMHRIQVGRVDGGGVRFRVED